MSDPTLDALAESARNRGLKLVRSRVRTPGKRRFGNVGLTDSSGKAVLGMDAKGPTAKPVDIEAYLRSLDAKDWGASLDAPQSKLGTKPKSARVPVPARAQHARPARNAPPKPKAPTKPLVRAAKPGDASDIVKLIALLGHDVDESGVRKRIGQLVNDKLAPVVATLDGQVSGLCGIDAMTAIHRSQPVGRINILVVAAEARGQGIGRMLVAAAEETLRKRGCGLVEVTSNDRLTEAHAFYRHMGFERTSIRFAKAL